MFIPPNLLAKAEILNADFPRDAQGTPNDDALTNTVTWLIETFTLKRSLDLTLAIARSIGEHHCIRVVKDDGSTSLALIAETSHQAGNKVEGNGVTIFGSAKITDLVQGLTGETDPHLQVGIAPSEREPQAQDATLFRLAELFPWYRKAMKLPSQSIDTQAVVNACLQLGMPGALIGK
jgi:hypothetical protein